MQGQTLYILLISHTILRQVLCIMGLHNYVNRRELLLSNYHNGDQQLLLAMQGEFISMIVSPLRGTTVLK